MSDDLAVLFPGKEVTAQGETLTVVPFFFGQFPKAIKLMQPVAQALRGSDIMDFSQDGGKVNFKISPDWVLKLPQIMAEGGEALIEMVAFATSKPRKWFDTLPGDEGVNLTKAVLEVNADFFVRKMLPIFGPVASPAIGGSSSAALSEPAIAGTTSAATP